MSSGSFPADLEDLVRRLEDVHPDFVASAGPERFEALRAEVTAQVAAVEDRAGFWWAAAPLVASAGDGHTVLWPPTPERTLPWTLDVRADGAWVLDWGGAAGPLLPADGARLVSIEGVSADLLVAEIGERYGAETDGFRRWRIQTEAWRALPIALGTHGARPRDVWHVALEVDGRRRESVVGLARVPDPPRRGWLNVWFADAHPGVRVEWVLAGGAGDRGGLRVGDRVLAVAVGDERREDPRDGELAPWIDREVRRGDVVRFTVDRGDGPQEVVVRAGRWRPWTASWTLSRLGDDLWIDLDGFEDPAGFEPALVRALAPPGPARVVVDLRGDDGGDAQMPELLCVYLCDSSPRGLAMDWRVSRASRRDQRRRFRPFGPLAAAFAPAGSFLRAATGSTWSWRPDPPPRAPEAYGGEVVVLTDGGTFSAAVYAAHLLREHAGAEIVGEPPGSGPRFHAHALTDWLPHSGLALQIASATFRVRGGDGPLVPDRPVPSRSALDAVLGG